MRFPLNRLSLALVTLVLAVIAGGYFWYRAQEQQIRQRVQNELTAIAQLKANQIAGWRQDRLADADVMAGALGVAGLVEWMTSGNPELGARIRTTLETVQRRYLYEDVLLVRPDGEVLLRSNDTGTLSETALSQLGMAFREGKPRIVDLYQPAGSDHPRLDVIAPLFLRDEDRAQALAAVVLSTGSNQYLDPLVQNWPMPSETAETLLVRRDGDDVLFLNELRHRKGTALKLRIPLTSQEVPAVAAASGKEDIFEGEDYRGVVVVSVIEPIRDSPWIMIAKIDAGEAFADVRRSAGLTWFLTSAAAMTVGIFGALLWQRRQRMVYQALFYAEHERGKAQEALGEREAELSAIWSSIPLLVFTVDRDRRIVKANPAAERFLQRCQGDMVGKTGGEAIGCLHSMDDPRGCGFGLSCQACEIRLSVLDTFETGNSHRDVEWRLPVTCDGKSTEFSFLVSTALLSIPARQVLVCLQDITELKRASELIKAAAAQLATANRELEAFSYSVSHDLRAPLRSMAGFSQALIEDYNNQLDQQGRQYLTRIQASCEMMGRLIDDLLELSRVTRTEVRREPVDLTALAQEILVELQQAEPQRQAEYTVAPGLVARGDSRLLRLMLRHLLENAWKFTGKAPSPRIEVGVAERDGQLTYFVRDNGVGFDMTYAEKLFLPFHRLHKANEFPGTGIGLATVQRIVHRHGGRVWAEGETGRGATFYFVLS